jgi:hypothetical protein
VIVENDVKNVMWFLNQNMMNVIVMFHVIMVVVLVMERQDLLDQLEVEEEVVVLLGQQVILVL